MTDPVRPLTNDQAVASDILHKYRIGDWEVSLTTCTLTQGDIAVKVTPRSMDVLDCLAQSPGNVISHEELLTRFWQGTFPSDHAVHKAIAELRSALGDDAHNPSFIRTIPKRGYSLIAEVIRPQVPATDTSATLLSPSGPRRPPFFSALVDRRLAAGIAAACVLLTLVFWPGSEVVSDKDEVVRLAVLPFINRGLNTENQFLTDGLRESLVDGLSKLSHMEVLSPSLGLVDDEEGRGAERPTAAGTSMRTTCCMAACRRQKGACGSPCN